MKTRAGGPTSAPEPTPAAKMALSRALPALVALGWALPAQAAPGGGDGGFSEALAQGPVYAALGAFASGLLVSFTPCVYPMVAVTVSVFGARQVESRLAGFLLSAAFVSGIVLAFVPLGVAAGLTGGVFGSFLSNEWFIVGLSTLFVALAASMFGLFDLDLPASLKNRLAEKGGSGLLGALVLGLICGPIAAPCTGPFLTGILAWITKTQSAAWGAGLMAAFAVGLGVPFFLVGTFALQLPKSGRWMLHVKSLMGLILLVVALYFLSTAYPALAGLAQPGWPFAVACVALVVVGLLLGAVHRSFEGSTPGVKVAKAVGVALVSVGAFLALSGAIKPGQTLAWESDLRQPGVSLLTERPREKALSEERPLLVDFTAAWCAVCKEVDKLTLSDERVQREAGRFVAVKVDATDDEDPLVEATLRAHGVAGLPVLILFDSKGREATRFTDFVDAESFLAALERVN